MNDKKHKKRSLNETLDIKNGKKLRKVSETYLEGDEPTEDLCRNFKEFEISVDNGKQDERATKALHPKMAGEYSDDECPSSSESFVSDQLNGSGSSDQPICGRDFLDVEAVEVDLGDEEEFSGECEDVNELVFEGGSRLFSSRTSTSERKQCRLSSKQKRKRTSKKIVNKLTKDDDQLLFTSLPKSESIEERNVRKYKAFIEKKFAVRNQFLVDNKKLGGEVNSQPLYYPPWMTFTPLLNKRDRYIANTMISVMVDPSSTQPYKKNLSSRVKNNLKNLVLRSKRKHWPECPFQRPLILPTKWSILIKYLRRCNKAEVMEIAMDMLKSEREVFPASLRDLVPRKGVPDEYTDIID